MLEKLFSWILFLCFPYGIASLYLRLRLRPLFLKSLNYFLGNSYHNQSFTFNKNIPILYLKGNTQELILSESRLICSFQIWKTKAN